MDLIQIIIVENNARIIAIIIESFIIFFFTELFLIEKPNRNMWLKLQKK